MKETAFVAFAVRDMKGRWRVRTAGAGAGAGCSQETARQNIGNVQIKAHT